MKNPKARNGARPSSGLTLDSKQWSGTVPFMSHMISKSQCLNSVHMDCFVYGIVPSKCREWLGPTQKFRTPGSFLQVLDVLSMAHADAEGVL